MPIRRIILRGAAAIRQYPIPAALIDLRRPYGARDLGHGLFAELTCEEILKVFSPQVAEYIDIVNPLGFIYFNREIL